jgi:aspartate/methionine/tyrosine aminotransferase
MYRGLEFEDSQKLPSACELYENCTILCGMSKTYSLPGLRVGWIISKN